MHHAIMKLNDLACSTTFFTSLRLLPFVLFSTPPLTYAFIYYIQRRRVRWISQYIQSLAWKFVEDGPMIKCISPQVRQQIFTNARHYYCATGCFNKSSSSVNSTTLLPLQTQVGGLSHPPLLKLEPNLILKPLHSDDRGLREVVFYEAIKLVSSCHSKKSTTHESPLLSNHQFFIDNFAVIPYLKLMRIIKDDHHRYSQMHKQYNVESYNVRRTHLCDTSMALSKPRLISEGEEYVLLSSSLQNIIKNEIEMLQQLKPFVPSYYGVHQEQQKEYLVLQDLTAPYRNPCVLDLKMGMQSYEPDATNARKKYEINKYPEQQHFGFRIVGMRVASHPHSEQQQQRLLDKHYGYSLKTEAQLHDSFQFFFRSNHEQNIRTDVIHEFLDQIQQLSLWFKQNQSLCFYASSLLLVYEGDCTYINPNNRPIVRMIDFGHVRRKIGGDHGYIHGMNTLVRLFNLVLQQEE